MIMQRKQKQGFTLIEILIVVAIIAILASVVLIGLGPTQQAGRDARRLSDLRETQNALELYYNAKGTYPAVATWSALSAAIVAANIGITQPLPNDPTNSGVYVYEYSVNGTDSAYVIATTLENKSNAVFTGYNAPDLTGFSGSVASCPAGGPTYCLTL